MTLPGPLAGSTGGLLWLEYANPTMGERHSLFVHVSWFDQAPAGVDNDRPYIAGGPVTPTEGGVLATAAALGALWAPYFSSDWSLHIQRLFLSSAGEMTVLPDTPVMTPIPGTDTTGAALPPLDRTFTLLGRTGGRRNLHLRQVPSAIVGAEREVSPTAGGFDARDRAVMGYLSGATGGGAVMPDGTYTFPVRAVKTWWARPLEPAPTGGGGGGGDASFTGDCLIWPLGGKICNPSGDVMTMDTPGGHFVWDDTGITLPGGHRLEVV